MLQAHKIRFAVTPPAATLSADGRADREWLAEAVLDLQR